ncbi:hypothetical protein ACIBCC_30525 [Streptomyces griseus]|uniref:hypothetical protein n=1 Tax=Streptomyces TaxID=1883 RepID=UPI0001C1CE99|nr:MULTISPECIES: hypothetical protein [Streptomyces]MYR48158.1 hypothetical protein [Streptomyces sp. SID4928]MYT78953.1 hypothetical protein [Streptomyces sp. SID8364]EGE40078.1 hypothetical protein SACT1_0689 [Streptomyces sp. ACT-1]SBU94050.1 hypothetical protein YW3DRAFT_05156 [Streptomyces sp. MnatMP-M77]SCD33275.1 hypothetical protein GA0115261_100017 [Streptomyces sp. OspMP-M43]
MLDADPTPRETVDLVVGDADESWEDLVRGLIEGPADPSRILTDCGGNGCNCAGCVGCGLNCMSGGWKCATCGSACC